MVVWLSVCVGAGLLLALASLVRGGRRAIRAGRMPLMLAPGAWLGMAVSLYGAFGLAALAFAPSVGALWPALAALGLTLPVAVGAERYLRADNAALLAVLGDDPYLADVTVTIPAHGVGAVSFLANGRRIFRPAASTDGRAIPRGASVLVLSFRRDRVVVEALTYGDRSDV